MINFERIWLQFKQINQKAHEIETNLKDFDVNLKKLSNLMHNLDQHALIGDQCIGLGSNCNT